MCSVYGFAAAIAAATDGYQVGLNAGILANAGFFGTETEAAGKLYLASPILGGWSGILPVGQVTANFALPFLTARYGRKAALYTCWTFLMTSIIAESLARRWEHWLVAKLLAGLGLGCLQGTLPAYISEIAPTRIRGLLLMSYNMWWTVGTFFAYVAMYVIQNQNSGDWLTPVLTQWAQIGIMLIIFVALPESPVWAVSRGQHARAKKSLGRLYQGVKDYNFEQQIEVLSLFVEHEKAVAVARNREKWHAIFRGADGFRTLVALWTIVSQQFTGLVLFSTFGAYFFQQAGIKCITLGIKIAAAISVVLIADRFGRRLIACWGTTIMWLASIAVGILGLVPRTMAGYIGEISSQRLRHYTASFGAGLSCIIGVGMNQLVPSSVNANAWNWGLKSGWFYGGVGLPFVIGMWLLIPETAGRSPAELDELFERKIRPWRFHKTETATQRVVAVDSSATMQPAGK
ncbi:LOW QUALITY PROTEIN: uncharacterized protein B0I36DRAFT_378320 [Microdochium trichocladiopsis]|uniref:Major facilitator superfamily (MFS) profile domain-containing protein n=1 Tax=Microdochium trichocladiopsis TaxID=1682393 RepID=A0A9P9BHY7_9PEZI|nr:LOW QUALITY PROTEIN: uncharacterized protein B0I36DRAFT_378320 [Microdochium trichocladiopsis]KAH7012565.1 LOW QUALITY PROTEIN: hypothetical protein B0I36DRAFT_378320 [Microdochium trichocladiopsis]